MSGPDDQAHAYVSTACLQRNASAFETLVAAGGWCAPSHDFHDQCRRNCKFCPAECACTCGHGEAKVSAASPSEPQ